MFVEREKPQFEVVNGKIGPACLNSGKRIFDTNMLKAPPKKKNVIELNIW